MRLLLVIPSNSGTIARVSYNLYKAIKQFTTFKIVVVNLSDSQTPGSFDFGNDVYTFQRSKYHNPLTSFYHKVIFVSKIKKSLSIDISISTLLGCDIINAITKKHDIAIGIFHAPISQVKIIGIGSYLLSIIAYKLFLDKLDRRVAVSQTVKQDLERFSRKSVEVIFNIHDFESISKNAEADVLDKDLKLLNDPFIIFVGHLYDIKGPDRLIKAFKLSGLNRKYNLVFVGDDVMCSLSKYRDLVRKLDLEKNVHFIGPRANPYPYIKKARVLISPSRSEGLPGVIIEALYLKTSVISTNSSRGVFEIMNVDQLYDKNLKSNLKTKYGIITPNLPKNENHNIRKLADAMEEELSREVSVFNFDYNRFSAHTVINKLLGDYLNL